MALKDLITQRAAMAEEQIEQIITSYLGYDVDEHVIVPLPPFAHLSNKQKVLVYLVALQGWPFVTEENVPTSASPSDLEKALGIPGGTLRPLLMELKDQHLITGSGKNYSVNAGRLASIKEEISGHEGEGAKVSAPQSRRRSRKSNQRSKPAGPRKKAAKKTGQRERKSKAARFDAWIDNGFFDEPKTLNDVHKQFHKEAQIVSKTAIPSYLLKAVDAGRLQREKAEVNGKEVWVYETKR